MTPAADVTFYVKWDLIVIYTVSFDIGSSGITGTAPGQQSAAAGSSITLPGNSGFSRYGYTFDGWNTNAGGTGTNYAAGATYTVNGNATLWAKWNPIPSHTVQFDLNGGTGTQPSAKTEFEGTSITLPIDSGFIKAGFTFGGWNANALGTGANYAAGGSYTVNGPATLFIKWNPVPVFSVTYDPNGGTGTAPVQIPVTAGTPITIPSGNSISRTGYTFVGWCLNINGSSYIYDPNDLYTVSSTTTFYAIWEIIPVYTISYDINGGIGTTPGSQMGIYEAVITLPNGIGLTKAGFRFGGWNANAGGTGTNYPVSEPYTILNNATLYAEWIALPNFTVTFNTNGGTGSTPAAETGYQGKVITLPSGAGLTNTGFTFSGWNTDPGGTGSNYNAGATYTITANTTLYARWISTPPTTFVVTFNINGGIGTAPTRGPVTSGTSITLPDQTGFNLPGHTFGGWNTNSTGTGTNYSANSSYIVYGDITLYAKWDRIPTYRISFNINNATGTTPPDRDEPFNASITLPGNSGFTRPGYIFEGWNSNAAGDGIDYSAGSSYTVTGNITFFAKWKAILTYTVLYDSNGSSGSNPPGRTEPEGTVINLSDGSGMSRPGYLFTGWNTNPTGTGVDYSGGASYTITENITFYAQWQLIPVYTISFDINSGTGTIPPGQPGEMNAVIILPMGTGFTRAGYTFDGWNTLADGTGSNFAAGAAYYITGTTMLYARWIEILNYTISFNINGGTGTTPSSRTEPDKTVINLPDGSGFSRTGFIFIGWNTNSGGTGTNFAPNAAYTITGTTTLFANWTPEIVIITYTVTYDRNGGTGTPPSPQTALAGNSIILQSGSGLSITGYTFDGWNTNADGTGTNYAAGTSYTVNTNTTLYAKWKINTYTVTFELNGGNVGGGSIPSQTIDYNSQVIRPADPVRTGYTFVRWYIVTGLVYNFSLSVTESFTIYALWEMD